MRDAYLPEVSKPPVQPDVPTVVQSWDEEVRGGYGAPPTHLRRVRTLTPEDQQQRDELSTQVELAKQGTDSLAWELANEELEEFLASRTVTHDITALSEQAQRNSAAYEQLLELGIQPSKY